MINMNPMMMGPMNSMGGMSQMFMMMQMMQMMQMMMSMMGSMGGGRPPCGCGHANMGQTMGMPGGYPGGMPFSPMPMPMPSPGGYPPYSGAGHAPPIGPGAMQNTTPTGQSILNSIRSCPTPATPGYCYRGVKRHLRQVGVNLTGGSAYMAADQLAQRQDRFREVTVNRSQLRQLPAGAVVVWDRSPGKRHGHISIATGDGREASDKIRNQITNRRASYRVFIPR